jgi:hypothetical protein
MKQSDSFRASQIASVSAFGGSLAMTFVFLVIARSLDLFVEMTKRSDVPEDTQTLFLLCRPTRQRHETHGYDVPRCHLSLFLLDEDEVLSEVRMSDGDHHPSTVF